MDPQVTEQNAEVKSAWKQRCLDWLDRNPRIGWYIAALVTLNTLLNLLDLVK